MSAAAYDSPQRQVAAVAESAFYLYERQLQRERQPELLIRLPEAAAAAPPQQGGAPGRASKKGQQELVLRVEFQGGGGGGSGAGLHFWQQYAATDNQVRRASAWLPCVDAPAAAVWWEGVELTCRADEVAVGPGQLQRQSWADAGRQWRSYHYAVPLSCPACQLGFAVGPFRMAPTSLPAPPSGAAAGGSGAQQQTQLTHFAPQRLPAELAVAAVLAAPPGVAPSAADTGGSAVDGLARSAHFLGLCWSLFEDVLGARCPLPSLQQVGGWAGCWAAARAGDEGACLLLPTAATGSPGWPLGSASSPALRPSTAAPQVFLPPELLLGSGGRGGRGSADATHLTPHPAAGH